jgi:hypothetical protein
MCTHQSRPENLEVLSGVVNEGIWAVVSTIWGAYLRAVSTELAVKD